MSKAKFTNIINFMFSNDCWFEYACECLGYSAADAKKAETLFNKKLAA